ncbi:hypothetical protein H5410_008859 [Solanum commersonii]|uniref:Uncharacterized protein n=1 Tax=Solanum commersonii TaxID=4109 RepID=A0A9J6AGU4_SOLCO|nr:hypothetical protein H5410_008859 [Solanum commersonii]
MFSFNNLLIMYCINDFVDYATYDIFSGPWHCWSKVPEHVRDKWFNDFENTFTNTIKDKVGETSTLRMKKVLK